MKIKKTKRPISRKNQSKINFIVFTFISFIGALVLLGSAWGKVTSILQSAHILGASTSVGSVMSPLISFSSDERTVKIGYSKGTWNLVRPDILQLSWMVSESNPYQGNIYWVSNSGNDSNSGSKQSPFQSIYKSLQVANAGDIIYVQPGTYIERIVFPKSGTDTKPIILSAAPHSLGLVKEMVSPQILQSSGNTDPNVSIPNGISNVWINGFVIEGYKGVSGAPAVEDFTASGIQLGSDNYGQGIYITNNVIYNALHCGIKGGGGTYEANVVFENGTNNLDHGAYLTKGNTNFLGNITFNNATHGIQSFTAPYTSYIGSNQRIVNNVSFGNGFAGTGGAGLLIGQGSSFIYNNVFADNAIGLAFYGNHYGVVSDTNDIFRNNIIAGNGTNITVDSSDGQSSSSRNNTIDHNDYFNGQTTPDCNSDSVSSLINSGAGTLCLNPQFVNAVSGDFRLSPSSPLIGKGINVQLAFSGSAPDMGILQSGNTIIPPTSTPHATSTPNPTPSPTPNPTTTPTTSAFQPTGVGGSWRSIFDDEFNGPSIDTSKWSFCYPWDCHTGGNNEIMVYSPKNIQIENVVDGLTGVGVIQLGKSLTCDGSYCSNYGSGLIQTGPPTIGAAPNFAFTYGFTEARIQAPYGVGYFPAFWMLGGPSEIDLMEIFGVSTNGRINGFSCGVHLHSYSSSWGCNPHGNNVLGSWHVFGVDWEPDHLTFYVDGVPVPGGSTTDKSLIPTDPEYLLLNFALGGKAVTPPDSTTIFPAYLKVDYVRVWKSAGTSSPTPTPVSTVPPTPTPTPNVSPTPTATPFITPIPTPTPSEGPISLGGLDLDSYCNSMNAGTALLSNGIWICSNTNQQIKMGFACIWEYPTAPNVTATQNVPGDAYSWTCYAHTTPILPTPTSTPTPTINPPHFTPTPNPTITSSACTGDGVYVYKDSNYSGDCSKFVGDEPSMIGTIVGNDSASSVRIVGSYSVTLYSDVNYQGNSTTITADTPHLRDTAVGNDTLSSLQVQSLNQ